MKLRRAAALMMVSVMAFAATGCGGGDDTKSMRILHWGKITKI